MTRMNIHMFRGPENTENTYVLLIPAANSYFLWRSQPHYNSSVPAVALKDIWWHTQKKIQNAHDFQKRGSINLKLSSQIRRLISFGRSSSSGLKNRPRPALRNIMRPVHKEDASVLADRHDLPSRARQFQIKNVCICLLNLTVKVHKLSNRFARRRKRDPRDRLQLANQNKFPCRCFFLGGVLL